MLNYHMSIPEIYLVKCHSYKTTPGLESGLGVTSLACSSAVLLLEVAIAQVMVVKSTGIVKDFPGEILQRMHISATAAGGKEL